MKNEDSYSQFLVKKQVKMFSYDGFTDLPLNHDKLKELIQHEMKQDRDLIDKASSAFVSFVRYYKEHTLQFIFSMKLLDIGHVANSFFLFKVPRVKEILGISLKTFVTDHTVKYEEVPYKDKNKEKQKEGLNQKRQEKLEWKEQKKQEDEDKMKQKRNVSKNQKKKRKAENDWNEWEELQKEENLFKKLKKGKISLKQFNDLVYNDSDFEEDESI